MTFTRRRINMLSNYPPGVSGNESIFGTHDHILSFTLSFSYDSELDEGEETTDIPNIIKTFTGVNDLYIDMTTLQIDKNYRYVVEVSYSDDIDIDPRYMDEDDVYKVILKHVNNLFLSCGIKLDIEDVSIEYEIHR